MRVLFLLKRREDFGSGGKWESGLSNSVNFVTDILNRAGVPAEAVIVTDNNCIDREVTRFKPTHCFIEGLWVVPSKFAVLVPLHPTVKWIVRLHSEMPFLANEGIAMDWIGDYVKCPHVYVAANAPRAYNDLRAYLGPYSKHLNKLLYLPNSYPTVEGRKRFRNHPIIDIGCFGAIRPLKNHLTQAIAALKFADAHGLMLNFHINANRIEQKGQPILNNLKGLFVHASGRGHNLVMHDWLPREEFLKLCGKMDIGLQVSFSETFNIVAADLISQGVPVVLSNEIPWGLGRYSADPTSTDDIANTLEFAMHWPKFNVILHQFRLNRYTARTKRIWLKYLYTNEGRKIEKAS